LLRFSILGSGSSGNAILVVSPKGKILIDNGLSFKQLLLRAAAVGEDLEGLKGDFITHEHVDHVLGIGTLTRRLGAPLFVTERTFERFPPGVGAIPDVRFFEPGDTLSVDGLELTSFSICHDAADPVSFVISSGRAKLGMAADLGRVSQLVKTRLQGSHALILESNYCPEMLRKGSYPPALQQRIRGSYGHLSNADMNSLLADLLHDGLKLVVLAHISAENNSHDHAREMAARVLQGHSAELYLARQDEPTPVFEISG